MQVIEYETFVLYRSKLKLASDDIKKYKKSAASNRLRSVKKHLDEIELTRENLNCESLGRLNHLQKMALEVDGILHPSK